MLVIVVGWLLCGGLFAALAVSARPGTHPGGPATAVVAGVCGGFLGGALVTLIAGRDAVATLDSAYGAGVGAIVLLKLTEHIYSWPPDREATERLAHAWEWVCFHDWELLTLLIAATAGLASDSVLVGAAAAAATIGLIYWQRNYGLTGGKRWRT